jgi:predicted transcriptional regulator
MNSPQAPHARPVRYSARHHARLDAATYAKLEAFAIAFHRKRSVILRYVMQWRLTQTRGWTVDMTIPGTVRTVGMLLEPELLRQVQDAATAHGASVATWVRRAMHQVTIEDFPQHASATGPVR